MSALPETPLLRDLSAGLTARRLAMADAAAVYEVMAEQEMYDVGSVEIAEADIVGDWLRPSFDVAASTVGVFDGETMVAYAEHSGHDRCDAAVRPAYRGRGIGTGLARWVQDLARSRGAAVVGMPVPQGSAGDRLLEALGYEKRWTSWVLELPEGAEIVAQPLPAGYQLRDAVSDADRRAVWTVVEDAFLEWSDRDRQSFEDFSATTVQRPGFEPWMMRLLVDDTGAAVGASCIVMAGETGVVDRLAVRRDRRGLGLARALLADSFTLARAHGATRSELSTDTRTGALGLYERVGMVVTSTWVNRAIRL